MNTKIKRFNRICMFIVFAVLAFNLSIALSAVPETINYQGSLSDNGDIPVNATLNITFTLYNVAAGPGTTLWQETQSVTITNGQFSVELGADELNPLPEPLDDPLFLGVQVDTDAEMTPRQRITSTPFALKARTVENDTLNSLSCSADEIPRFNGSVWVCAADIDTDTNAATICPNGTFLNGDGTCDVITDTNTTYSAGNGLVLNGTVFSIPTDGINATHLAPNSVGTSEVQNGTITAADLATNSVGPAEIQTNAVGTLEVEDNSLTSNDLAADSVSIDELADLARGVGVNGSIVIHASAFQLENDTLTYTLAVAGYIRPGNGPICMQAPVNLPHGVTVTHFEISVVDNSAVVDVGPFELRRIAFSNGVSSIMASAESTGSSPAVLVFSDTTINNGLIDGFADSYNIFGCMTPDIINANNTRFYAARIRYN